MSYVRSSGLRDAYSIRGNGSTQIGFRCVTGVERGGRSGIASNSQRCGSKLVHYSRGTEISSFGFRL